MMGVAIQKLLGAHIPFLSSRVSIYIHSNKKDLSYFQDVMFHPVTSNPNRAFKVCEISKEWLYQHHFLPVSFCGQTF